MGHSSAIATVVVLAACSACNSGPSNGTTTATGTASTGTTSTGGGSNPTAQVKPAAGQTFASMALAAEGGEAELFYAEYGTGAADFNLQHLSLSGAMLGSAVQVATGTPQSPPVTAVSSDGTEIACCWEDFAPDPRAGEGTPLSVVLCNSVPVGGSAPDLAMDGGFIDMGHGPRMAASSGATIVVYAELGIALVEEELYKPWGYGNDVGPGVTVNDWSMVAVPGGFEIFARANDQLTTTLVEPDLMHGQAQPVSVPDSGAGTFAAISSGTSIGLVFENGAVAASVLDIDAGSSSTVATLSAVGDKPLPALAAATCAGGSFGFAYALPGGDVMFREMALDGTPTTGASTLVANFGTDPTGLALAPGDGGLLLAVGASGRIAVFGVACP